MEDKITLDKVAMWLGEKEINLKLAQEQIDRLEKEIEKLNQKLLKCKCHVEN